MHLNKIEAEIVASLLYESLLEDISELEKHYARESDLPEEIKSKIETKRNLFRRLKKELGIALEETDALCIGLLEEVSPETINEFQRKIEKYRNPWTGKVKWWEMPLLPRLVFFFETNPFNTS